VAQGARNVSDAVPACRQLPETSVERHDHSENEQQLTPVPVADRSEIQDGRGEAERESHRNEIELGLAGIERLADIGQGDEGHREIQIGDRGPQNQREQLPPDRPAEGGEAASGAPGPGRMVVSDTLAPIVVALTAESISVVASRRKAVADTFVATRLGD